MEKHLLQLLKEAKKNSKNLNDLKSLAVRCHLFEFASDLRKTQKELFPETAKSDIQILKDPINGNDEIYIPALKDIYSGAGKYKLNAQWLKSLGFVKIDPTGNDEELDQGFLYYDPNAGGLGIKIFLSESQSMLFISKFHGENKPERDWNNVVRGVKIYSDDELYFVMSRLAFINSVLKIYDKPINIEGMV